MNNNTNQSQNVSSLDEIFGTAKAVTSTLNGMVDVASAAYHNGVNVINNAQQQSSNFYCDDNSSRRNQQQQAYQNMYNNSYGYGYGVNGSYNNGYYNSQQYPTNNIGGYYNNNGLFNTSGNNYGYQGISNQSYGIMNNM